MDFEQKVHLVMKEFKSCGWDWEDSFDEEFYLILSKYFNPEDEQVSFAKWKKEQRKKELLIELAALEMEENN